jgi:hypothetical protein
MAQRGVHYHTSDMAHEGETEKKNCMKNTSIVDIRHCKQTQEKYFWRLSKIVRVRHVSSSCSFFLVSEQINTLKMTKLKGENK